MKLFKFVIPVLLALLVTLPGCSVVAPPQPVTPATQPATQPSAAVQQEIALWNATNFGFQFSVAELQNLHADGTISDADWNTLYDPAINDGQELISAWHDAIGTPGSPAAQAKFAATSLNIALLVIQAQSPHKPAKTTVPPATQPAGFVFERGGQYAEREIRRIKPTWERKI
jgi:hypothetical protein